MEVYGTLSACSAGVPDQALKGNPMELLQALRLDKKIEDGADCSR